MDDKKEWGIWYYKKKCCHEDGDSIYMAKIRSIKEFPSDIYHILTFNIKTKTPTKVLRKIVGGNERYTKEEMNERIEG